MPWSEVSVVDQRYWVVQKVESGIWNVTEAAVQAGVHRKTVHKWLKRYRELGVAGLSDHSRAPHHRPRQAPREMLDPLLELRRKHPHWGARKLRQIIQTRHPDIAWPSASTIHRAVDAAGLVRHRRRRRRYAVPWQPLGPVEAPNGVWTVDFKGEFRLGNRRLCYPLTVQDYASRSVLLCQGMDGPRQLQTQEAMTRLFRERGLPAGLLSDCGSPFAGRGLARLSRLSVWWLKLGIRLYRTRPSSPQDNPRHERMHRDLKAATARPPAASMAAQQRRFDEFVKEYNELRPHEALGLLPPAQVYVRTERPFPEEIEPWDYPGHFEVRKVDVSGRMSWYDVPVRISVALRWEYIGLEEIDEGIWDLFFRDLRLGRFDERSLSVSS